MVKCQTLIGQILNLQYIFQRDHINILLFNKNKKIFDILYKNINAIFKILNRQLKDNGKILDVKID